MPESHKHPRERSITGRSWQQYPGGIAAGGLATLEGLPGAKTRARGAKKRLIGNNENRGWQRTLVSAQAGADCRDLTIVKNH